MIKIVPILILSVLLSGCVIPDSERICVREATPVKITPFVLDDGLIGKDTIEYVVEYDTGEIEQMRDYDIKEHDLRVGKVRCLESELRVIPNPDPND